jgi:histidinol phosphatase-like enzyme (inositol monophosphatase family)
LTLKGKRRQALNPVSKPDPADFQAYMAMAHALADRAGAVILPHFRTGTAVDHKGGKSFDPVTTADRDAERAIREALADAYPAHGIVGEEFGNECADAEFCWIIDPIDGTRAFIMGHPMWGTLIGLTKGGVPLLGLMDQPFTRERFWSGECEAFFRHGDETTAMRTRACPALAEAVLTSTTPDMFEGRDVNRFERLARAVRLRRFGGDCYNYCLLAMGQIDLVVESGLKPFDILPLIPIVERAGGLVSTWEGGDPRDGGRIIAAGDPRLHAMAVDVLST